MSISRPIILMIPAFLAQYILENLSTAVLWFNEKQRLEAINPAGEVMLEISAKQAKGMEIDNLLPGAALTPETLRQVLRKRCPMIEKGVRLYISDSHAITVDYSIIPINDEPHLNHILLELARTDQHLRVTREENLFMQQQTVRNVIRGLAHEIKNPLGGLRGAAQLLERELPDKQLTEYTEIIIREADRLQSLLDRLLEPKMRCHKRLVNIHHILMQVRQLILSEAGNGVIIESDFDPSIPEFLADTDQLVQAILNIMRNAVQAVNYQGKIHLRTRVHRQITLGNKRYKLVIRTDITDNGAGVPRDMINQIFYPLVTGRADGTGLGLSIAQSIINRHNGFIECNSQPGETIFTLWIPMDIEPI